MSTRRKSLQKQKSCNCPDNLSTKSIDENGDVFVMCLNDNCHKN
jgi:hypothetical protein